MAGEWRASTWGQEISLEYGKSLRDYRNAGGKFRVFGSNGAIGWTERPLAKGPGVILGRKGAYRGVEFSRDPFFVIDTAYYVVPKSELDMRWLYYAIKYHQLGEIDDGSPIPSTTRSAVYVRDLDVPPLPEQRAIASVLGTLDDLIELNLETNEILEEMARALFKSWFVDFDPVRAKLEGRPPAGMDAATAALFPDHFQDSELGQIPMGWEVKPLAEMIEVVKGRSYRSDELAPSTTALVTLKSFLRGGGYRADGLKSFTGEYKPSQVVRPGDLIVAFTDVTQAAEVIGKPALVRGDGQFQTLVASLDVGIVRTKTEFLPIPFLYCLFLTESFQAHTYAHSSGTTVLHLSKEALPSFPCVVPPKEIARKFGGIAGNIFNLIEENTAESRDLAALRDTLLPKLLSGEVSAPAAESLIAAST